MRVLVLGGGGMLGHKLWQVCRDRFDTWVAVRSGFGTYARYGIFDRERTLTGVDAFNFDTVVRAVATVRPNVVVNAIGIIKQLPSAQDPITSLTINSLFPHRLRGLCRASGARMLHVSTDCVFDGRRGMYTEEDMPSPEDLYGRSKLLGEVDGPGCLTLRTSIIGRELDTASGLVEWFLSNAGGQVKGYTSAIYTGFPTLTLAHIIADVIANHPELSGLYQVSSDHIDKYRLLCQLREAYRVEIDILPDAAVRIDRSLDSRRFREATGFAPASWPDMVQAMASDPTPYDKWRQTNALGR